MNTATYLAFDYGTQKIGVAVGQPLTGTASPLQTVRAVRQKTNWAQISTLIETWQPSGLVVGIASHADGSDNAVTPAMRRFCRQLEGRYRRPVYPVDETLTTFAAKALLSEDLGLKQDKLLPVLDQVAAQLILQAWFEQHSSEHPVSETDL